MICSYTHDKALLYKRQALIDQAFTPDNQAMTDAPKKPTEKLANRITELIRNSGKKSNEIAAECGVTPQAVNGWKKTGRISKDMLQILAGVLNVEMADFFGGQKEWTRRLRELRDEIEGVSRPAKTAELHSIVGRQHPSDQVEISQYNEIGGSMGGGLILRDQPGEIQSWRVTPDWITQNVKSHTGAGNLRIVTGFGDSMRPLFNPGDPLLVDAGVKAVEFDSIYFFRIGEEGFIKRLQRVPGQGLVAISENKSYRDWTITPDMDFEVFARVIKVWCGSDF